MFLFLREKKLTTKQQKTQTGQRLTIAYEDREFDVIVIDPHGLGYNQPSIGFGFRMAEKYMGIPEPTLSQWYTGLSICTDDSNVEFSSLKVSSGKEFRLIQIEPEDNKRYLVVEASEWINLVTDLLRHPGKIRQKTKNKLIDFLVWFAIKGFYAEAYTALKGTGDETHTG